MATVISKPDVTKLRQSLLKVSQAVEAAQRAMDAGLNVEEELLRAQDLKNRLEMILREYGN